MAAPDFLTDEHLLFLDELRSSGRVNMFGARPYLLEEFPELTPDEARKIVLHWMETFGERQKAKESA